MKMKHVITTFSLSVALGLGVFAGVALNHNEVKEVEATAATTLYFDVDAATQGNERYAAYFFEGGDPVWQDLPRLTNSYAEGNPNVVYCGVPSGYAKVILCRMNGAVAENNWDNKWDQSNDLTIPTDGKNFYVSGAPIGGGKLDDGTWALRELGVGLRGSNIGWSYGDQLSMHEDGTNIYVYENLALAANETIKAVNYESNSWAYVDVAEVSCDHDFEYPVSIDSGNAKVSVAGNYDVVVNVQTGAYQFLALDYVAPAMTAVYNNVVDLEFVPDESDLPDGMVHQWSVTLNNPAISKVIKFYKDGVEITSNITVSLGSNNIMGDTTNAFRIHNSYASTKIYLKQYNDSSYEVWASNYNVDGLYIDDAELAYDDDFEPSGNYVEQYALASASYTAGDQIGATTANRGYPFTLVAEAVAGNNLYTEDGKIYVHNDCTAVLYAKRAKDGKFYLYLGGYEEPHVLTVGATEYPMTLVNGEYKATNVALTAGQALNVKIGGVAVDGLAAEAIHNNNMTSDMKALVNATGADVYYKPGTNVLWVGGIPANGYHILLNETTLVQMTHGEDSDGFTQWYSDSVAFAVNDTILFIDSSENLGNHLPNVFGIGKISEYGLYANFEVVAGEPAKLKCKTACSAQVYMKLKTGNDEVYFGAEPEGIDAAKAYAADFIDKIGTACNGNDPVQATLEAAWDLQKTNYNALPEKAKEALQTNNSIEVLNTFRAKYLRVIERRGENGAAWAIDDFMGIAPAAPSNINIFGVNTNNYAALIAIIASVSVVAVVGLYFIIRRKKHQ